MPNSRSMLAPDSSGVAAPSLRRRTTRTHRGDGYRSWGLTLVVLAIAVVCMRLHEAFPAATYVRPALLLSVGGTGLLILRTAPRRVREAFRDTSVRLGLIYLLFAVVTLPFALWPALAFETSRMIMSGVLLILAIALIRPNVRSLDKLQVAIVLLAGAMALMALIVGNRELGRLEQGYTYDSNDLASLLAVFFPIGMGVLFRSRGHLRVLSVVALVVTLVAITQTASRGGFLGLVVGACVMVVGLRGQRFLLMVVAMTLGGTVLWSFSGEQFRERIVSLVSLEQDYNLTDTGGRKAVWTRGLGYVGERPILGAGAGNFPEADGRYWRREGGGRWQAAHNSYLQVAVEMGIPGLVIFLLMLGVAGARAARFFRPRGELQREGGHRPELMAALVAYAVTAFFLSLAYVYFLFTTIGLIVLAHRAFPRRPKRTRSRVSLGARGHRAPTDVAPLQPHL